MKNDLFFILRIVSAGLTDTKNDFTADTTKHFCSSGLIVSECVVFR
jgi:hypothetical protein